MLHEELTEKIIKAFYKVYNTLGYGFLEKVYERAMCIELDKMGFGFKPQKPIKVYYDNQVIGDYSADIAVEDKVIVELKASKKLSTDNEAQLLNYLRATEMEIGLLFNFGKKPEFKRKIFTNDMKGLKQEHSGIKRNADGTDRANLMDLCIRFKLSMNKYRKYNNYC